MKKTDKDATPSTSTSLHKIGWPAYQRRDWLAPWYRFLQDCCISAGFFDDFEPGISALGKIGYW